MCLFHIEVQCPGDRILLSGDVLEFRGDAVDQAALNFISVLIKEANAEDAVSIRIGFELLHYQVVILTGLNIRAVLTDAAAERLICLLVLLLHRLKRRERLAATLYREFVKGVAGAGSRRRTQDFDLRVRQRRSDVTAGLVRIGD